MDEELDQEMPPPIKGYVRSGVTHLNAKWIFEQLSESPKVALVTVETQDGPVFLGITEETAGSLEKSLSLFLAKVAGGA